MIEVCRLVKHHDALRVLDGASLAVARGEVAALIGPSGSGKSTLLRCVNALEPFDEGEVRVGETRLAAGPARRDSGARLQQLRGRVGMVFQQFNLFPHLSVLQNVAAGPRFAQGRPRAEAEAEAEQLLARVGLADKKLARPDQLSGGQQQRVAIARALAVRPAALLFDEPTSALDPRSTAEVLGVMTDLAAAGMTMLVVTHVMRFARTVARTVHVMHAGRVVEAGPAGELFEQPQHEATRAFLAENRFD
ncbi:MAG: amino acid ABC transporter ATP-binding protein [Planctomycetes bacterium]|nr:amino acid ABC transporter ATP-binding protein [Planctomycetota bacterium]